MSLLTAICFLALVVSNLILVILMRRFIGSLRSMVVVFMVAPCITTIVFVLTIVMLILIIPFAVLRVLGKIIRSKKFVSRK